MEVVKLGRMRLSLEHLFAAYALPELIHRSKAQVPAGVPIVKQANTHQRQGHRYAIGVGLVGMQITWHWGPPVPLYAHHVRFKTTRL